MAAKTLDLKLLPVLKETLIKATDFKQPMSYFYDHFGEVPGFERQGRDAKDASLLIAMVAEVAKMLLKDKTELITLVVREIPEYAFVHGLFMLSGLPASVIYFSDVEIGLLAMPKPGNPHKEVAYVRFTGTQMRQAGKAATLH